MAMPIALRLAVRQWAARPLRPMLCSLAIAAAVALIVCVGAAMDSLKSSSIASAIGRALGVARGACAAGAAGDRCAGGEEMLERVRGMPEVEFAEGRLLSKGC